MSISLRSMRQILARKRCRPFSAVPLLDYANAQKPSPNASHSFREGEPSRYIDRVEEHYWQSLAEDIAILTYDHRQVRPYTKGLPGHMQPERDMVKERLKNMLTPIPLNEEEAVALRKEKPFVWEEAIPAITKLTLSISMPEAIAKPENLVYGAAALHQITGEPPKITFASRTVSGWSLKKDSPWGAVVTLLPHTLANNTFLQKWGDMVLPKIRNIGPYKADFIHHSARMAGMALPKEALRFFPELEEFGDKYPMWATLNLLFNFNEATRDAVDARLLISSLGIPIRNA